MLGSISKQELFLMVGLNSALLPHSCLWILRGFRMSLYEPTGTQCRKFTFISQPGALLLRYPSSQECRKGLKGVLKIRVPRDFLC